MRKATVLLITLAAWIVAPSAQATHTDPAGECDVNVPPTGTSSTADYDQYFNPAGYSHYEGADGIATICFDAGIHRHGNDSGGSGDEPNVIDIEDNATSRA